MGLSREDVRQGQRSGGRQKRPVPTEVVLRIDELVLEGFVARDSWRIAASLQAELTRLLAERGLPPAVLGAGIVATVATDDFSPGPTDRPEAIGTRIARAVYAGLGQEATGQRTEGSGR